MMNERSRALAEEAAKATKCKKERARMRAALKADDAAKVKFAADPTRMGPMANKKAPIDVLSRSRPLTSAGAPNA